MADDVSVLLSIFLSRPQNLLAVGHPVSKFYRRASRASLLLGQAWEWLADGYACDFWGVAKVQIGTGTPRGKEDCWTLN